MYVSHALSYSLDASVVLSMNCTSLTESKLWVFPTFFLCYIETWTAEGAWEKLPFSFSYTHKNLCLLIFLDLWPLTFYLLTLHQNPAELSRPVFGNCCL